MVEGVQHVSKLCECGCGGIALRRFVNGHNVRILPPEEQQRRGRLNTGAALLDSGLQLTYRKVGQRHEHRTVAEQKIGRPLLPGEVVHHIDGNHRNNAPENLQVMSAADHLREHRPAMMALRKLKRGY